MIARLHGTLIEKHPNQAVVDCGGVGYDVLIPVSTFTALPDPGKPVRLRIHTHVREDAIVLYGFQTQEEKGLFERLISVSGIGPKLAITVLSGVPAEDLVQLIRGSDVARLTRIPGIGKKTAERIVLELKDKVGLPGKEMAVKGMPFVAVPPEEADVVSALINLGCQPAAAEAAARKASAELPGATFEPLFRRALELLR